MGETELTVSIYEQIGGEAAITATVEAFYARVLVDPLLQPFFVGVELDILKRQQMAFFSQALGGPEVYRGPDMKTVHEQMGIQQQHFDRVAQHLDATLESLGVPQEPIDMIMQAVGSLATDIVNTEPSIRTELTKSTSPPKTKKKQKESRMGQNGIRRKGGAATLDAPTNLMDLEGKVAAINKFQAVIEFALDGTVITANENFLQILGYSLAEVQGQHHRMFCDPAYVVGPEYGAFWAKMNRGEFDAGSYRRLKKGGKEVWLQASYNPILDPAGKPLKVVKIAMDITAAKKLELEAARIQNMMENAPINVMFVDLDLVLRYMNPASTKTLKTLEHLLPVKVDDIIGTCIDVFHKNPQHQRKLLSDPKNLPYRAIIELAGETLDLLVSPIFDDAKVYLGAMATWDVITNKLEQERQIKELAEREKQQQRKLQEGVEEIAQIGSNLAAASEELMSVSNTMGSTAEETSCQANMVAAAAEEVSTNVQSVSTGSEEMTASIKEIAKNTIDAAKVAAEAVSVAATTNEMVAKLGKSSAEIGSIIKVINSIAQQTNLLALNATIEAARAGEAGKGFAVVANEVKELAKQTTKATESISRMIETIQGDTKGSVEAISQITTIIKQVDDYMNTIASAVEEQTVTTNEMARNVTEASKGSMEIAGNIVSVADAARGTTEGATQTQRASSELARMAADLQKVVATLA
ncbi:MAG: methyl-accepting chemotaxis protein [Nitrospirota bacterium]|nr:methyl-accepting chemotaxis protein [Nitrospirota bacterium]